MAVPVVESNNTASSTSSTTVTITKPTGLAVGDLMVAYIFAIRIGSHSLNTPSGWTSQVNVSVADANRPFACFTKVADSGDTGATNFSFTSTQTCDAMLGILTRISGAAEVSTVEGDTNSPSSTSMSFTGTTTPEVTDALVLMGMCAFAGNGSTTISSYASTPSKTWTEVADLTVDSATDDPVLSLASATSGSLTEITAYSATLSVSKSHHGGILLTISPPTNASGTAALHSADADFFEPTAAVGTTGTNALLQADADFVAPRAEATAPTQWTPEAKPSTTWTPTSK